MAKRSVGNPFERQTPTISELNKRRASTPETQLVHVPTLALDNEGKVALERFTATRVGIQLPGDMTHEEWLTVGFKLMDIETVIDWCLADWLAYGEDRKWGKTYMEIADRYNVETDTLYHYANVARSVKFWIRNPELRIAHHRLVASMKTEDEQSYWLNRAADEKWTVKEMRLAIKAAKAVQDVEPPPPLSERDVQIGDSLAQLHDTITEIQRKWSRGGELLIDKISQIRDLLTQLERFIGD